MLRITFSTIAILAYGAIYFLLASLMEAEYVKQSYYAKLWRWIFPLLVFDFFLRLYFDSTIPAGPTGDEWLQSLAIGLWFMAPAYYFNFKIARYGLPYQVR